MGKITVASHTLGCKVNQCDTDAVLQLLEEAGCLIANFNDIADVYFINTCTVTHASDKKSRQVIRRAKRQNPQAFVAVCGCMAKNDPDIAKQLGVDFIFDARNPKEFVQMIKGMKAPDTISNTVEVHPRYHTRTRAFVKIQDGCDRFCSYCIVPYVRGGPKSRTVEDITLEVKGLVASGVLEVVLTGIQVASYGLDIGSCLTKLLDTLLENTNIKRLRLSSIEPCAIDANFISIATKSQVLCDHLHLSLQSGSNAVLDRMNRRYTASKYAEIVENIRAIKPQIAITTDIIVGFPGETDEEFNETLEFVKKIKFARIHVFEYSKREGTPAAKHPGQVADSVKTARSKILRNLAAEQQKEFYKWFYQQNIGNNVTVLFETAKTPYTWQGYTTNYCPVEVFSKINLANSIQQVTITSFSQDGLVGELANDIKEI